MSGYPGLAQYPDRLLDRLYRMALLRGAIGQSVEQGQQGAQSVAGLSDHKGGT